MERVLPTSNPYSSGAVVFDSSPYTNLFIKKIQEEKAKDEAFDKYFQDFGKSINSAGMRQQDTSDFINLMNNNKQFYLQNKAAIKNPSLDNGRALSQYQSGVQEASSYVNNSKQIAQKEDLINKTLIDARKKGLPITNSVIEKLQSIRQPLKSNNWKDFNVEDLEFEKPFDAIKFSKDIMGGVQFDDLVLGTPKIDPIKKSKITTYQKSINKESLPSIRERGQYAYDERPEVMEQVDLIMQDEDKLKKLNEVFRQKYNEDIQSGGDIAAAIALSLSPIGSTRDVVTTYTPTRDIRGSSISGKENSTTDWVQRFKKAKETGTVDDMIEIGRELYSGKGSKEFVNLEVNKDNKGITVWYKPKHNGITLDEVQTKYFSPTDPNLYPKLAGLFQELTGSNASLKKNIFTGKADYTTKEQNKSQRPVTKETKTFIFPQGKTKF